MEDWLRAEREIDAELDDAKLISVPSRIACISGPADENSFGNHPVAAGHRITLVLSTACGRSQIAVSSFRNQWPIHRAGRRGLDQRTRPHARCDVPALMSDEMNALSGTSRTIVSCHAVPLG